MADAQLVCVTCSERNRDRLRCFNCVCDAVPGFLALCVGLRDGCCDSERFSYLYIQHYRDSVVIGVAPLHANRVCVCCTLRPRFCLHTQHGQRRGLGQRLCGAQSERTCIALALPVLVCDAQRQRDGKPLRESKPQRKDLAQRVRERRGH